MALRISYCSGHLKIIETYINNDREGIKPTAKSNKKPIYWSQINILSVTMLETHTNEASYEGNLCTYLNVFF